MHHFFRTFFPHLLHFVSDSIISLSIFYCRNFFTILGWKWAWTLLLLLANALCVAFVKKQKRSINSKNKFRYVLEFKQYAHASICALSNKKNNKKWSVYAFLTEKCLFKCTTTNNRNDGWWWDVNSFARSRHTKSDTSTQYLIRM